MELEIGAVVEGKVTGITKFGAFVSLPGGRSGLVHISEIAYSYVSDVAEHLSEGKEVKVKIIGIDETNRINLSIKKAMDPPPRSEGDGERPPRAPRENRPQGQGRPAGGAPRFNGPRNGGYVKPAPGPETFEDRLKQFMQNSDSKLSEMKCNERKTSRRGGGGRK